jgi:hypothetical protein
MLKQIWLTPHRLRRYMMEGTKMAIENGKLTQWGSAALEDAAS